MPLFSYKAVDNQGAMEEGEINAADQTACLTQLQSRGLIPIRVEAAKGRTFLGVPLGDASSRLPFKDIAMLTGELATLLESGLPLDRSLQVLMQLTAANERLGKLIGKVLDDVKGGASLAEALERQNGVFSRFYLNMIRAGEMGGNLADVLVRLADYMERSRELRDTVTTALIYPTILLVMSVASLFVMLTFVVPQFTEMFESSGQALPLPTQIVVGLAEWLQTYWWLILSVVLIASSYMKIQLADPVRKKVWDARFIRMPLFGSIILNMEIANLSRTLGTLLGNGVAILKALGVVRETVSNSVIADVVIDAEQQLKQGRNISDVLAQSEIFPGMAVQMIKMGEETGRLEEMFLRIANIYDKQLRTAIQRMLALLEPALIISLGLMIAGIIISILMAILSVNDMVF